MDKMLASLRELLADACSKTQSGTIALSGGLDSSILACLLGGRMMQGVAVIAQDHTSTDLTYCQVASKEFGMGLSICRTSTADLLDAVGETVRILGNFNDIEIRNSVVMYLAIRWAKDRDITGIITGDGADELFAGYQFLLGKDREQLQGELERLSEIMHFPSHKIGKSLGVKVESPFLDGYVSEFARTIPAEYMIREHDGRKYGKWILRKAFEGMLPEKILWRPKSPMQDGAGTAGLTGLFESVIGDGTFAEKKAAILDSDGVSVRTKESLYYYEAYRRAHGPYRPTGGGRACPHCGFAIGGSVFCRMCGAFPV